MIKSIRQLELESPNKIAFISLHKMYFVAEYAINKGNILSSVSEIDDVPTIIVERFYCESHNIPLDMTDFIFEACQSEILEQIQRGIAA